MRERYNSYSKEKREEICKEFQSSMMSYRDFAYEHNLKLGTLAGWISEYRRINGIYESTGINNEFGYDDNSENDIFGDDHNEHNVYTAEYKVAMVEQYRKSNLSLREFSKKHNIPKSTFIEWNNKCTNNPTLNNNEAVSNSFIDVTNNLIMPNNFKVREFSLSNIIGASEEIADKSIVRIRYCNSIIEVDESRLLSVLEVIKRVEV